MIRIWKCRWPTTVRDLKSADLFRASSVLELQKQDIHHSTYQLIKTAKPNHANQPTNPSPTPTNLPTNLPTYLRTSQRPITKPPNQTKPNHANKPTNNHAKQPTN